jgi:Flp pilus assembly protein TadG
MKTARTEDNQRQIRGQVLVEFTLVLLLLLVLLFSITEFARGWHSVNALTNSARAGARYASELQKSDDATFVTNVKNYTFNQITSTLHATPDTDVFVDVSAVSPSGQAKSFANISSGDAVSVIVTYNFQFLSGQIIPFISGTEPLTRRATMRYEQGS